MTSSVSSYKAILQERRWLSPRAFEITLDRPAAFHFQPGQYMGLYQGKEARDYSPVSAPGDPDLRLCIRHVSDGRFSSALSEAAIGSQLTFTGPHGYFTFKPSQRPAVWVATGSGIAPFCSMARSGVEGFMLLHGVSDPADLYYAEIFQAAAGAYEPCLSAANHTKAYFQGRVTDYIKNRLPSKPYDFYLCGRRDMVREVTYLVDELFPDSLVYSEIFY